MEMEQADSYTGRQAGRQASIQMVRWTDNRQTETERQASGFMLKKLETCGNDLSALCTIQIVHFFDRTLMSLNSGKQ